MKRKITILLTLSAMALTSCFSGKNSSNSSGTSSGTSSSNSSNSSSSSEVISEVYNTLKCVEDLVAVADQYRPGQVSVADVLEKIDSFGEDIETSSKSQKAVSEVGFTLAFYFTFKDVLPERIGARSFQGLTFKSTAVSISSVNNKSKIQAVLDDLANWGIYDTPRGGILSGGKAFVASKLKTYLDRVHAYFGESYTDDFFSTVNHDYLYDDNPYQYAPNDGRLSPDEVYDSENLKSIYNSNLIPESRILDWILERAEEMPDVANFIDTYSDFDARATGNAAGLVEQLNKYLNCSSAAELIEVMREQVITTGYCPLWESAENGMYSFTNGATRVLMNVTTFSYSASSPASVAPGSAEWTKSVNRFRPIFQDVLGCSDEQAQTYAENYSTFKFQLASNQRDWSAPVSGDQYAFLTNDAEAAGKYDSQTNVAFEGTGELLFDFFKSVGVDNPDSVMFASRCDIESIAKMFTDEYLPLVKGLFIWQSLQHFVICLPDTEAVSGWAYKPGYGNNKETLVDNKDMFYSRIYEYVSGIITNNWLSTARFEADYEAVSGLLLDIKEAMRNRIAAADWLSQDARDKALLKTNDMKFVIGGRGSDGTDFVFSDVNYDKVATGGSLCENIGRYQAVAWADAAKEVGEDWKLYPLSKMFKTFDPLTANAFYYSGFNAIYITLGFMAAYDNAGEASTLDLYSGYGWVLAHEFSHGFDSSGVYYDNTGAYHEEGWFNSKDQDAYNSRTKAVSSFYDGYEVMPGKATSGKTVITEACADINGLRLILEASKNISGFDYEQFFKNCATNFGAYASQYTYTAALASDEHSFGRARVNLAMMSVDEWHQTFGTKEGDNMWVAPEDRIAIW